MNNPNSTERIDRLASSPSGSIPEPPPELSIAEFRRLGYCAVDLAADHLAGLRTHPVFSPMSPRSRESLLEQPLPEAGLSPDTILNRFQEHILPYPMGNGHPRFFGWVNSPPARLGILAELLAAALNPSCAGGDHAAIYLERCAIRWLMELVGFPTEGSMGLLVSGASMATLTCLAAARHWAATIDGWNDRIEGLQTSRPQLVLYVSSEGHACLHKSAELLGLGASGLRVIPTTPDFKMDLEALRTAVQSDRAAGLRPFCVAASAGTVNTGTIDRLNTIAEFCAEQGLWFHVDGAYGGIGALEPELAPLYAGMTRADSLVLDPHKWLSVPVECGCAMVRDGTLLRETFSLVPPYLRTEEGKGFGGLPWFSEYGFQQTRGFRALKLWMTLQHLGRSGVKALVSHHITLARNLASLIDSAPDMERLAAVELSVVCFRYVPDALRANQTRLDSLNKQIMEEAQAGGEAFLSGTTVNNRFALRGCVLNYQTIKEDIEALIEVIRRAGARLLKQ